MWLLRLVVKLYFDSFRLFDVNQSLAGSNGLFTDTQSLSEYYDIWCSCPWMPHDSRYYQINDNDGRVRIQVSMLCFNNFKIICLIIPIIVPFNIKVESRNIWQFVKECRVS